MKVLYTLLFVFFLSCSTEPEVVHGCLDSTACNYNSSATIDNDSCWKADGVCTCEDGDGAFQYIYGIDYSQQNSTNVYDCASEIEVEDCQIYNNFETDIIQPEVAVNVGWITIESDDISVGNITLRSSCFNPNCTFGLDNMSPALACIEAFGCYEVTSIIYNPALCSIISHPTLLPSTMCNPENEKITYQVCL